VSRLSGALVHFPDTPYNRHALGVAETKAERVARRGRRVVRLTSADRVLFPEDGVTKGDLFDYYRAVAPVLVPHLRNRPFTMKRFREGAARGFFFQKDAPKGMPDWIPTRRFRTQRREGDTRLVDFPLVNDELALLWMVQMHCIDMNAWYSRVDKPTRPDFVLFDLDPPDGGFRLGTRVAHLVHDLLDEVGLVGYVKTSGADGIHVLAPVTRRSTFDSTRDFAMIAAELLVRRQPDLVTTEWRKEKRHGVFLDARQNGWGRTIASVYSVRPKPGAPVSTPLHWEELTEDVEPRDFGMAEVLERVEREGDLFAPVLEAPQALAPARRALDKLSG
jgi:bifunctional non-homologous end joining protein LigD